MKKNKKKNLVYLSLGGNLRNHSYNNIRKLLVNTSKRLHFAGLRVQKFSNFYISSPMPFTSGPNFVNCVFKCLITGNKSCTPQKLYENIVNIEKKLGKKKKRKNKARFIDIDILDFEGRIYEGNLILPHPRLHLRKFVLEPLENVSSSWQHPIFKKKISYLKIKINTHQRIRKL